MDKTPSAYTDDAHQGRMSRTDPAFSRHALTDVVDHAKDHQGGGTTGEIGGHRPAEVTTSPLAPIDGRDRFPGDNPEARGEIHWDTPLPHSLVLSAPLGSLETLRHAGSLLSGEVTTMVHSQALQDAGKLVVRAAKSGAPEDVSLASEHLERLLRAEGLM